MKTDFDRPGFWRWLLNSLRKVPRAIQETARLARRNSEKIEVVGGGYSAIILFVTACVKGILVLGVIGILMMFISLHGMYRLANPKKR